MSGGDDRAWADEEASAAVEAAREVDAECADPAPGDGSRVRDPDTVIGPNDDFEDGGSLFNKGRCFRGFGAAFAARFGERLLEEVFVDGVRTRSPKSARDLRQRVSDQIQSMPEEYKRLRNPEIYPVLLSRNLVKLKGSLLAAEIR